MNNKSNIITQKLKHGIFSYYKNDKYIGKSLREYGEFSENEVYLFKQLTKTNDNVIEVGSNIGTHTIPLAKHLSQGGWLYALEPQSQNYKILIKNINQNDLQNIKVFKIAASNKKGEAYMNLMKKKS
jgi:predicted O-methyltransferase YrrM